MADLESSSDLGSLLANDSVQQKLESTALHSRNAASSALEGRMLNHAAGRRSVLVQRADAENLASAHRERVMAAFQLIDIDKNGELDAGEIVRGIHKNADVRAILLLAADSELTATEYDALFARIDVDNSAGVSLEEFEVFVDTIFREERQKKMDEAERKREEEEKRLADEHKLGIKLAEERATAARETLEIVKETFSKTLGMDEVENALSRVKAEVTKFLTSDRPLERELAEAYYEVWESKRLLKIQLEGRSDHEDIVDPEYEAKHKVWTARLQKWQRWKNVDEAFTSLAGEHRETVSLDHVIDALEKGDAEFLSLLSLTPKPSALTSLLFGAVEEEAGEEKKAAERAGR